jgi:hypothetical protein
MQFGARAARAMDSQKTSDGMRHARQVSVVRAPIFPCYLFAIELERDRWRSVDTTVGVARLITADDRPLAVPHRNVETLIQQFDEIYLAWPARARQPAACSRAVLADLTADYAWIAIVDLRLWYGGDLAGDRAATSVSAELTARRQRNRPLGARLVFRVSHGGNRNRHPYRSPAIQFKFAWPEREHS